MTRTLVLIRHAKSDWSHAVGDRERPLAPRGRRQAPAIGQWLEEHLGVGLDLAVTSTAVRARQTWELVAAELDADVPVRTEPEAYTFSGRGLRSVIAGLPAEVASVAVVGHNPAMEDVVTALTGQDCAMPTSSLAVIELAAWSDDSGTLIAAGRPADGALLA